MIRLNLLYNVEKIAYGTWLTKLTVWDCRAVDKAELREKPIDTPSRTIYDLLWLTEYTSVDYRTYRNEFRRSRSFE